MRRSKEEAQRTRDRVVDAAGTLFRQRGIDGIGLADLMAAAGLTHGGFYRHFPSKEALAGEAAARSLERTAARLASKAGTAPKEQAWRAIVEAYLSPLHRDDPGHGCAIATIGSDIARLDPASRRRFEAALTNYIDAVAARLPGRTKAARRQRAMASVASLVGAVIMARAVEDPGTSDAILAAVRDHLLAPSSRRKSGSRRRQSAPPLTAR